jgi:spore coat protein U-like protein
LLAGLIGFTGMANAATATGPLMVTARVEATCVVGASTLAFGNATSAAIAAGNVDATGAISVNCTSGSRYTVALDAGAGTGATVDIRKMMSGTNTLSYTIFSDAGRTTVWGTATGATFASTGTGVAQSLTAYGRILMAPLAIAASYSDTVNVTVSY